MPKFYITKYALTTGIEVVEAESTINDNVIRVADCGINTYYHGDDWHATWTRAVERAEEMRTKRIASLEKSLRKIRALTFPLTPAES